MEILATIVLLSVLFIFMVLMFRPSLKHEERIDSKIEYATEMIPPQMTGYKRIISKKPRTKRTRTSRPKHKFHRQKK